MGTVDNAFNRLDCLTSATSEFGRYRLVQGADLAADTVRRSTCSAKACCAPTPD